MAGAGWETGEQLERLTECCICFKAFTDPRMLPCIHTFCLQCLEQIRKILPKKQRKNMPCPICRKVFPVPAEGLSGLPKNFFMENLKDVKSTLQLNRSNSPVVACDICKAVYEEEKAMIKEATMWCFQCEMNFCDFCSKAHKVQSKDHHVVKLGNETENAMQVIKMLPPTRNCSDHKQKPLDFYCADCRTLLCVSCFVETHALHKCKDVTTIENEMRKTIQTNALKISGYSDEIVAQGRALEQRRQNAISKLAQTESEIRRRNVELKEIVDKHAASLLDELSVIKEKQSKHFEVEKEEVEILRFILDGYEDYCNQLISTGSASQVCGCVNDVIKRVDDMGKGCKEFLNRPFSLINVSFEATDLETLCPLSSCNILGRIQGLVFSF